MARYATATKQHTPQPAHRVPALTGGRPLQAHTRAKMDARFGHDFSSVRIHADDTAARIARSAGANALTLGNDILFGSGRYTPGNRSSERLLSHELAHVVQQEKSGPGDPTRVSQRDDPSEREAEKAEDLVAAGSPVQISAAPDSAIARDENNTCSSNDDDGDGLSFWNRIMNVARGATTTLETGADYKDTKNFLEQSEEYRDAQERDAFFKTEKQAASQASSPSSSPAEATGEVSDVNPSYNAMEPNTEPTFEFNQKLSSGGFAGSQEEAGTGVFQESLPGVSDPVAVKVMSADRSAYFENELDAAQAGERTGYGPRVYGEQSIPDVNGEARRGFAMEKVEGGFTDAAAGATEAEKAEAARWGQEVTPGTLEDVHNFNEAMIGEGFASGGDLQGFVTPGGGWRPIDFGSYNRLPDPALDPQGYAEALQMSRDAVRWEQNALRPHMFNNMMNDSLQGMPPDQGRSTPLDSAEFEPNAQNASQLPPDAQTINSSINDSLQGTPPEQLNEGATPLEPTDLTQTNIDNSITEQLNRTGGDAPLPENHASEPLNSDAFGNTSKAASETEELLQAGSTWGKLAKGMHIANNIMNPVGLFTNSISMYQDIEQGRWGHAALDAAGAASSGIGAGASLASSLGLGSEVATLGPIGAVAGAGVGGYAAGEMALNQANKYAKNNNIFGDNRDSTEAAGDAGQWVRNKLHSKYLPDFVGDMYGAEAAIISSWGTALYSGGHALGSGIESGASWLWDKATGGGEKVDQEALNNMSEQMGQTMDQQDAQETESELYTPHGSSAHEEMPPLPQEEQKK